MEAKDNPKYSYLHFQTRWRNSINQLSKLEEQSQISQIDTLFKRTSTLKLKMKNRLGQIDDSFYPVHQNIKTFPVDPSQNQKLRVASTNHDTNIFTIGSSDTQIRLQKSLIIQSQEPNPEEADEKFIYKFHEIRQELVQELTQYNNSRYKDQMKLYCSKYNQSLKSVFYSMIDHPKKQLYQFCYMCDQIITDNRTTIKANENHKCICPLNSISRVQQALMRIQQYVESQNNKIFHVFLHNALQPEVDIEELITNVTVLKQSLQHEYEPEEAVLRLRLMNLIGKKIGLLMEEKQLQNRLKNVLISLKSSK